MKKQTLIITICFISLALQGQPGFSRWYDFDLAAGFRNVLQKEDTILLMGTAKDYEANQWGALFAKMDTFGTILDYRLHLDSTDGQFSFDKGYPFIATSEGGYLLVGKVFNRESYFVYKLDANGDVVFFREYYEPDGVRIVLPGHLLEVDQGYILVSRVQRQNYEIDIMVTKINDEGAVMWEQMYGEYSLSETAGSIWKEDDNTIVLGCKKSTGEVLNPPSPIFCQYHWIFALDSLGNMKWEWLSEPCAGNGVTGLQRSADGGWIYASLKMEVYDQWNWGGAPKFVRRDSAFNLLWEHQVGESYWDFNAAIDLEPTPEGDWVLGGVWVQPEPYNSLLPGYFYPPSCLYKVTDQGERVWERCDTVAMDNNTSFHSYGGIEVLPSGSIIAAGVFTESLPGIGAKSWAWATKVDKDGCMEAPDCLPVSIVEEESEVLACNVYPNPAREKLRVVANNDIRLLRLFSVSGALLREYDIGASSTVIDVSDLSTGVYFLSVSFKEDYTIRRFIKME